MLVVGSSLIMMSNYDDGLRWLRSQTPPKKTKVWMENNDKVLLRLSFLVMEDSKEMILYRFHSQTNKQTTTTQSKQCNPNSKHANVRDE
jgi:hypothetical protein